MGVEGRLEKDTVALSTADLFSVLVLHAQGDRSSRGKVFKVSYDTNLFRKSYVL